MKISFIIPVYNVAKYLHQCVRSILEQRYQDIEVILVNDGSKDESPAICDAFADNDKRVKVIHKENGGLSDARSAGLKAATGEYVVFVDGDDFWLSKDDLSGLMAVAEKQPKADFIGYNCKYYYPDTESNSPWVAYCDKLSKAVDKNTAMVELVKSGTFPMSACLKLMKREFLIKNDLFFVKGQIAEDIPWFINVLDNCDKCSFVNQYVYAYRQNVSGSITASGGERSFNNLLEIIKNELNLLDRRTFNDDAKDALRSFLAYELSILISTVNTLPKRRRNTMRKELNNMCWLLGYTINPKVKMVGAVYHLGGFRITELMLRCYDWYRERRS